VVSSSSSSLAVLEHLAARASRGRLAYDSSSGIQQLHLEIPQAPRPLPNNTFLTYHQTQTPSKWYESYHACWSALTDKSNRQHRTPPASRRCSMYVNQDNTPTCFHTESRRPPENIFPQRQNIGMHTSHTWCHGGAIGGDDEHQDPELIPGNRQSVRRRRLSRRVRLSTFVHGSRDWVGPRARRKGDPAYRTLTERDSRGCLANVFTARECKSQHPIAS
jgi:hypothetical protein